MSLPDIKVERDTWPARARGGKRRIYTLCQRIPRTSSYNTLDLTAKQAETAIRELLWAMGYKEARLTGRGIPA